MPEGDTLHFMASSLRPHLVGQPIEHLYLRERGEVGPVRGHPVDGVEVVGKHLLVLIDRRWTLHVHLGMKGRWRTVPTSEGWRFTPSRNTAAVVTSQIALIISRSARHELRPYRDMRLEHELRRLGPDLLAPTFDAASVVARARAPGHRDVAVTDLLLDQTVASGIGNVYRSEVLFMAGLYPWRRVEAVEDAVLAAIFESARALMQPNVGPGRRVTMGRTDAGRRRPGMPRLWVYRRKGLPCHRCQTPIRRSIEGRQARSTYWCPRCQPKPREI